MEQIRRVDIGFQGGQVLPLRVPQDAYDKFRRALADSGEQGWYELKTQNSEVAVDLAQVVYVRLDVEEQRVGF